MIGATLCSGIGAPECAAPWIDWRWHAEIEAFPAAVHARRFPGSVNLGDMTAPDLVERAAFIALPDVIVAGTPCQAFSLAGSRGSLDDARGNLTLQFVRICNAIDDLRRAAGLRPLWILWENVPGVFSTNDNAFGSLLGAMVGADAAIKPPRGRGWTYSGVVSGPERCAAWRVMDAQYIGLAQRRERVFVLARGGAGTWAAADALLPIVEGVHWHPAPRREARERVARPVAAGSPGGSGYRNDADTADNPIAGTLRHAGGGSDIDHARANHIIPLGLGDDGQLARALNACHTASGRHDVSVDTFVAHTLRASYDATEDGSGRGTPLVPVSVALRGRFEGATAEMGDDIAFALRASSGGGDKPHVLAHAFDARQSDVIQYGDRAGPLDTDGHSQAIAFTQNSRSEVCEIGGDGSIVGALAVSAGVQQQNYVAFSSKDHGADAGEIAPTMRAMGHSGSHANAGGQIAVCIFNGAENASTQEADPDKTLRALRDAVGEKAFAEWRSRILDSLQSPEILRAFLHGRGVRCAAREAGRWVDDGTSPCAEGLPASSLRELWRDGPDGRSSQGRGLAQQLAAQLGQALPVLPFEGTPPLAVRRLTPREAERLQGFPDDFTLVEYRGKPAADGPRYKALGNSMAVPVMRYLLKRITDTDAADA